MLPASGLAEQSPEDWYAQTLKGLKKLLEKCDRSQVAGISFGGQMHGLVVLDSRDQVIRPQFYGMTAEWKRDRYLNHTVGRDKLSQYTANIAFAGFTAPKLLWMKENEPDLFAKIAKIMLPKDYLAYRLSGAFCTDYSDASGTLLLDVQHRCWSGDAGDLFGERRTASQAL